MPNQSPPLSPPIDDLSWLSGGGEMGALIRSMDWSRTSLGPLAGWPQSLRTSVSLCLSSTFPILVAWGADDVQIYNDAYRPICGGKHPASMGEPFRICWATALPVVGDAFDRAHEGEGAYIRDQRMFLDRYGYLEEAFMTFSFSPIRDESGAVGGVFHPITETTGQVLNARRTRILRDLTASIGAARSIDEIGAHMAAQYDSLSLDVPFLLFYQIDATGGAVALRGSAGLAPGSALAPAFAALDEGPWPFAQLVADRGARQVDGLDARLGGEPCGPYEEPPRSAMVLPVVLPGQQEPFGFLVAGVSARRVLDEDYRHFHALLLAAVNTAVSNVLAYEQEQRRAEELAQIDRAKTAFFSNVSHEFRTPLTLILGPLDDALADRDDALSARQRQRIEVTQRNALRLLKLVNSLLDFSRIEAGRVQASYTPVDLARLTADLASVFEAAMAKGGLDYRLDLQALDEPVYVDREMWEKIVFNLLSNAFKFTLHGAVTVTLRRHGAMARLSVGDTGSGIPADELPRVFERFHRIEGTPGRTFEGSGIGLALIQELVRLHGGAIGVRSTVGVGTTFDVDLPFGSGHLDPARIVPDSDANGEARTGASFVEEALRWLPDGDDAPAARGLDRTAPPPAADRPRILVADDNNDMRAYVKALLEPYADVVACADGEAAFEQLGHELPDLLLSDVMMPRLDGFGLLERIRASDTLRHLPVMLLSARAGEEARIEGLGAGADDYLVKPFSANELLARVRRQVALGRERQSHRREAQLQEAYFRTLVDASPVTLWTTDAGGCCTYLSQRWYDYTGRTPEQDLGLGWLENVHPDDLPPTREKFRLASAAGLPFSIDYRLRRHDGSYRWAIDAGMPRFDGDGRPAGFVGTVIDVHERKVLQQRFERVAQAGDIGVWYADAPFTNFQMNAQMAAHFDLDGQRDMALAALLEQVDPGHRAALADGIAQAVAGGAPLDVELRVAGAGQRWLRAVGWCDLDDAGTPLRFDGVTFDISTHKLAQQELQRLASELAEKNRMQSEFLVTLAHELRNPLAPIRTGLELMRAGAPAAALPDVRNMMERQVDHMVHLVNDLLDVARLTQGKLTLRREMIVLADVVHQAIDMSMPLVKSRKHELAVHLPEQAVLLDADRHRIAQVLGNLLNNSAKYTPPGGRIVLDARVTPAGVTVAVSDNGVGIGLDLLPAVFELYTQAPHRDGVVQGGLGVGLNLVRKLVQLHGGDVAAASDGAGKGSTFTVTLPCADVVHAPSGDVTQVHVAAGRLRILAVDDNADAVESLAALLALEGHDVQVAYDGARALALAADFGPEVVLLDIGLPGMDGYDTARAMRALPGLDHATLIAVTGWGTEQDRLRSARAGFDLHLTKPVELARLRAILADAAARR